MFTIQVPCSSHTCESNHVFKLSLWAYLLNVIFTWDLYPYYCMDCVREFEQMTEDDWEEVRLNCRGN
jgi:hypothetical protein